MAKPFKKALTISTCMLVAIALTIGAVAWFSGYKVIGNVGFDSASNAKLPEMVMWTYYSKNDGAGENETGWVDQSKELESDTSGNEEYWVIPDIVENVVTDENGNEKLTYQISSLHFGKVDNLVTLSDDNKVYLRFKFDSSIVTTGAHVLRITLAYNTVGYSRAEYAVTTETENGKTQYVAVKTKDVTSVMDSIYLYQDAGVRKDLEIPAKLDPIATSDTLAYHPMYVLEYYENNPTAMQFLQFRYAISNQELSPDEAEFQNLAFTEDPTPIHWGNSTSQHSNAIVDAPVTDSKGEPVLDDNKQPVTQKVVGCTACADKKCGVATIPDLAKTLEENDCDLDEGFYLYVELAPLLDAFGMQENILDFFVPAYMFFDVKLDVEIG